MLAWHNSTGSLARNAYWIPGHELNPYVWGGIHHYYPGHDLGYDKEWSNHDKFLIILT